MDCVWGILFGMILAGICWLASSLSYRRYLVDKARKQYRSPVCINGHFFYIVPEHEYNETLNRN